MANKSKLLYTPKEVGYVAPDYGVSDIKYNEDQLEKIDNEAKEKGILIGRYIKEPMADGYAIYQIIKELKTKVKIVLCTGLGDDYVLPCWGEETNIDKDYAITSIKSRDTISALFKKKNN